jgi:hypothetical protein
MKENLTKPLFTYMLVLMIVSCDKKAEMLEKISDVKVQAVAKEVYPLDGNEMSATILPKRQLPKGTLRIYEEGLNWKVKVIDTVCDEYIKETKPFDISGVKEGERRRSISNGELTITAAPEFNDSFLIKLPKGPTGWWTHWNYSPYTESEYPNVLFCLNEYFENSISLAFNKPVSIFGFETAPNTLGKDYTLQVTYRLDRTYRSASVFSITQTASSPSGASLIAIKTTAPIVYLEIGYGGTLEDLPRFAIANIRYALERRP